MGRLQPLPAVRTPRRRRSISPEDVFSDEAASAPPLAETSDEADEAEEADEPEESESLKSLKTLTKIDESEGRRRARLLEAQTWAFPCGGATVALTGHRGGEERGIGAFAPWCSDRVSDAFVHHALLSEDEGVRDAIRERWGEDAVGDHCCPSARSCSRIPPSSNEIRAALRTRARKCSGDAWLGVR